MTQRDRELIGRQREQAELDQALAAARHGSGGIVLLAGEAGVGKTRLLEACLARSEILALVGQTSEIATPPYGPIAAALRSYLRARPGALAAYGPLAPYLALLLPELGPPPERTDPAVLGEAICQAFVAIARDTPAVLVLDDLQWADNATLELAPILASALAQERLLILGTYRNDEIGRGHPLRRLRNDLRRARLLREIVVEPLNQASATAFAARILGQPPGPALAAALYERTEGVPLFVEELAGALALRGRLHPSEDGIELAPGAELPIPDTLRDAVLLRLDGLPDPALRLLHLAVVAGRAFDLGLVAELAGGADGYDALLARGLLVEVEPGRGAFRHPLTREAIYGDISWVRRRALHRQMAERLEAAGVAPLAIAQHWLAAKEPDRARAALLAAAEQACAIQAYRDAADAAQRALELWPDGVEDAQRLDVLDQLGQCAQLCGLLSEAARAWREVADGRRQTGDLRAYAVTERKLANVAELQGHWERALAAHEAAAQSFAASDLPSEAAAERLSAAAHLRSAGRYRAALELLSIAVAEAAQAGRPDLHARSLALEGNVRARMGQLPQGLALVQRGLALALEHNLASAVAEIYQRLADSLEHAGDYAGAKETYLTAFDFCQANAVPATAQLCVACLTVVLRQTGEWERAMTLCREVLASQHSSTHARAVASCMLGSLYAQRGQPGRAQPLLLEAAALAQRIELAAAELLAAWGLALLDEQGGAYDRGAERCRLILSRWEQIEDVHYAVPALRWAVSFFATTSAGADARACANALARIASASGQPEALSALAHALGELALLDGDPQQAVQQFGQALDLLRDVAVPHCHATTQLRAGIACAAADQRNAAVAYLTNAYRTARKLGARPLATRVAQALEALGEPIVERLGQGAAGRFRSGDLTRRQREILQLVALGQTNAEIARALVISPRTVEMHVANILAILDSRSRAEAVRRATELGLLEDYGMAPKKNHEAETMRYAARSLKTRWSLVFLVLVAACAGAPAEPTAPPPTSPPAVSVTTATAAPDSAVEVAGVSANASSIGQYAKLELTLDIRAEYQNAFDPAQIDVQGVFTAPDGRAISVPGFYWQNYTSALSGSRELLRPSGDPAWKVRFTPQTAGRWTYTVRVTTPAGSAETAPANVEVTPAGKHGFVRVSPRDPAYLAFDDGTPYVAIGQNVGWYGPGGTRDYERWFGKMRASGANFARLWMASWAMGIEWSDTGLGDYTRRLDRAWQLDRVFELAEQNDIYLMLSLLNHGAFNTKTNPEWDQNPYNAALGGPCAKPEEFATNPRARELFKRRLRYIAARWGYSPNLLAWEWWNEVEWTPLADRALLGPWIEEMSAFLKPLDPYGHLRTTSYAHDGDAQIFAMPEIDLVQRHEYDQRDPAQTFPANMHTLRKIGKPILYGEFGADANLTDATSPDRAGVHIHNGMWAAIMTKGAGTAMSWWWDSYVAPLDLYHLFAGPAAFLRGEDLAGAGYQPEQIKARGGNATALILKSPARVLGWVKNNGYSYANVQTQYTSALLKAHNDASKLNNFTPSYLPVSDATVTIAGLPPGAYRIEWWNTQGQAPQQTVALTADASGLVLPVPAFDQDLAFKIIPSS